MRPLALDEDLELIGLVEMRRRHGARRLHDEEGLRQAVVVDLVALDVDALLRRRPDILGEGVAAPVHLDLPASLHCLLGRCRKRHALPP